MISFSAFQETGQKGMMRLLVQEPLPDDIVQNRLSEQVIQYLLLFDHSDYGELLGHLLEENVPLQKIRDYGL